MVRLDGAPFKAFAAQRERWAVETDYVYPGPIQYFGPAEEWIAGGVPITMMMNMERRHGEMITGYPESFGKTGWCSFQGICRYA